MNQTAPSETNNLYDEKADMFSLGIILFEMCHKPFVTGMERFVTLKRLRETSECPPDFLKKDSTEESLRKIIIWLVQLDRNKRPAASELLVSSVLPSRTDTDEVYMKELNDALHNYTFRKSVISLLYKSPDGDMRAISDNDQTENFSNTLSVQNSLSYDLEDLKKSLLHLQPRPYRFNVPTFNNSLVKSCSISKRYNHQIKPSDVQECTINSLFWVNKLKEILKNQFEVHGAVNFSPPLLQLRLSPSINLLSGLKNNNDINDPMSNTDNSLATFLDSGINVSIIYYFIIIIL